MKRRFKIIMLILSIAMLLLVGTAGVFSENNLLYSGCGIVKNAFMAEMAKAFTEAYSTPVVVQGGGATLGIRNAVAGRTDFGGTCRHLIPAPEEEGAVLHHVAWDCLAFIVHRDNPVDTITLDQVKEVIEGKIKNWRALGGPDRALYFYAREGKISGVGRMARELIFFDPEKDFMAVKRFPSSGPLEQAIEKDPWAIGITGISSARKRNVKILRLNGIATSKENVAAGKYILYRPLYLVTKGEPTGLTKQFIDFVRSKKGQEVISNEGTVTLWEGRNLWPIYREQMKRLMLELGVEQY